MQALLKCGYFLCCDIFAWNLVAIGEDSKGTIAASGIVGEERPKAKEKAARCWH